MTPHRDIDPDTLRRLLAARERGPWAESDALLLLAGQIAAALMLLAICIHGIYNHFTP